MEKGQNFYDFQFNTRLVKSTIVHFQVPTLSTDFKASVFIGLLWSYRGISYAVGNFSCFQIRISEESYHNFVPSLTERTVQLNLNMYGLSVLSSFIPFSKNVDCDSRVQLLVPRN